MLILGACFMCNIGASQLINTGAFEITYEGAHVWSKMDTGRFPQMNELQESLSTAMQLVARA